MLERLSDKELIQHLFDIALEQTTRVRVTNKDKNGRTREASEGRFGRISNEELGELRAASKAEADKRGISILPLSEAVQLTETREQREHNLRYWLASQAWNSTYSRSVSGICRQAREHRPSE